MINWHCVRSIGAYWHAAIDPHLHQSPLFYGVRRMQAEGMAILTLILNLLYTWLNLPVVNQLTFPPDHPRWETGNLSSRLPRDVKPLTFPPVCLAR